MTERYFKLKSKRYCVRGYCLDNLHDAKRLESQLEELEQLRLVREYLKGDP